MNDKRTLVEVETPNKPGKYYRVDASKRGNAEGTAEAVAVKAAGAILRGMHDSITPLLPESLFPGGEKRGWWLKPVQLDLEAKNLIARSDTSPLR